MEKLQKEIEGLSNSEVSNETKLILRMLVECTKTLEKKVESEVKNLKDELNIVKTEVTQNSYKIAMITEDLERHKTECEGSDSSSRKLLRQTDQKLLENDILLKGFPDDSSDTNEVKQNLAAICNIEYGFSNSYKFSRVIGNDKKTKQPITIHMMSFSLISKLDKEKILRKVREEGHLTLGDLLTNCPPDAKSKQIWIDHKLTRENLALRKRLLQLKREGLIDGFTMRSGLFLASRKDSTGRSSTFSITEYSDLLKQFPEATQINSKRSRDHDSSSPATPSQNSKLSKVVGKQSSSSAGKSSKK